MERALSTTDTVFALDIGTNSVVGIIGTSSGEKFTIAHSVIRYHTKRAMVDGQIHDIPGVLEIVQEVKKEMEKKAGFKLKHVSIAAAGRALKTLKLSESIPLNQNKEITRDQMKLLELEGLKKAHEEMNGMQEDEIRYFCVGHSLTKFLVDEMDIANPIGQKGRELTGHLIATFLPEIVVNSLHTVMAKAGLQVERMTLEPIAALDIIVPENIRLLNIALVDIGAGTSDIAITKDGTIVGYGMTDVAGDEITEEIAKALLLGFDQAEALKCKLREEKEYTITNVLGETQRISRKEVIIKIQGRVDFIAKKIGQEIIAINGKASSAVFLVGGGSQIPGMADSIARHLNLPENRVVIKTITDIDGFLVNTQSISGPESITPLGIFKKSLADHREDFIEVTVNHKEFKMFQRNDLKIGDALALAKVDPKVFIPKPPKEVTVVLEGRKKRILCPEVERTSIYLNDKVAGIDSSIKNRDRIYIDHNRSSDDACFSLRDLLPDQWHENYSYYVNEKKMSLDAKVKDSDIIVLYEKKNKETIRQDEVPKIQKRIEVHVNKVPVTIPISKGPVVFTEVFEHIDFDRREAKGRLVMLLNGRKAGFLDELQEGDHLEIFWA